MNINNEGKYGKFIIQELQDNSGGSPEFKQMYKKFADRILWMDGSMIEGAVQMNTSWYCDVPERDPVFDEHVHPQDEVIGFFGSDPEDKYNLNGELELAINGEWHRVTKSSLIFIPANMPHMPLSIKRVDKPIFHFSFVIGPEYNNAAYD